MPDGGFRIDPTAARVRAVTYDRPGYGGSDRLPGRQVAHAASDIKAIADGLGIASFAVIGISGGGPHALAAAAGLPDRVTRCATIVGLSWGFDVAAIASPTVVMIAREDTTVPRGHGVWIAGHVTGAVRVKVDGGHFGPRVEPEERLLGWAGGADIEVAG